MAIFTATTGVSVLLFLALVITVTQLCLLLSSVRFHLLSGIALIYYTTFIFYSGEGSNYDTLSLSLFAERFSANSLR